MKTGIYLDTSVVSALFDERTPERMAQTLEAWETLKDYDVYLSEVVISELKGTQAGRREKLMGAVAGFTVLKVTDEARELASEYVAQGVFPEKYYDDALHVAVASVNRIGVLLSWNFTHLVKMKTRRMVALLNTIKNYAAVEIISPPEL